MAFQRIRDDAYIRKVRELFASMYGRDLEIVLWQEGSKVCNDAFFVRTINYHNCMLPWIESVFSVAGASVLEIGCGSGAATLAVAQRCAQIDSFDIDAISLGLARERAAAFGVKNASFNQLNTQWALPHKISEFHNHVQREEYDVVLLPAVLEHLRMDERLRAGGHLGHTPIWRHYGNL